MKNKYIEIKNSYLGLSTHRFLSHWLLYCFSQLCSVFLAQIENQMSFYTRPSSPIHDHNKLSLKSTVWVSLLMGWESLDKKMSLAYRMGCLMVGTFLHLLVCIIQCRHYTLRLLVLKVVDQG